VPRPSSQAWLVSARRNRDCTVFGVLLIKENVLMSTVIEAPTKIDLEDAAVVRSKPDKPTDRELVDQARAEGLELVGEN
jgi:hypothetical protein